MATATILGEATRSQGILPPYRFTVRQYHRLVEAGILHSGERVELLEGCLVSKMNQNPPHPTAVELVRALLAARLTSQWTIRSQAPISTIDSEPEPVLAVVLGPIRRYQRAHPRPAEIALVVEVADTTVEEDRGRKQRIYARARLPVYWILNLSEKQLEVYTQPRRGRTPTYLKREDYSSDDAVALVVGGLSLGTIAIRDMLP
jgi:Uma2 family endonuclease